MNIEFWHRSSKFKIYCSLCVKYEYFTNKKENIIKHADFCGEKRENFAKNLKKVSS
jgi:hypothetical protein